MLSSVIVFRLFMVPVFRNNWLFTCLIPHHSLISGVGHGMGPGIVEIVPVIRIRSPLIHVSINMKFFMMLRETGLTVLATAAFVKGYFSLPAQPALFE
jgi:hypothetical protein